MDSTDERYLVTGASGMLGAAIARTLIEQGARVRTLSRSDPRRHPFLADRTFEHIAGDITVASDVAASILGCSHVFHVAGLVSYKRSDSRKLHAVNVTGTENVVKACHAARVRRLVVTSSTAALGLSKRPGEVLDETHQPDAGDLKIDYIATKYAAERMALAERRLDVVVVSPATIYGAGDVHLNTGVVFRQIKAGQLGWIPPGGLGVVSIEDCVTGHLLAMQQGNPGEKYILCSENCLYADLFPLMASALGAPAPRHRLPGAFRVPLKAIGGIADGIANLFHRDSALRNAIVLGFAKRFYSGEKARRDLGWRPAQDLSSMIHEAADFYRVHNLI